MTPKGFLSILSFFSVLSMIMPLYLSAHVTYADPQSVDVPSDFPTIQAAIDNATDGDTVFVHKGTYNESIVVNKTVTLVGEDVEATIINGSNSQVPVRISSEGVNLSNFTVRGSQSDTYEGAILVESSFSNIVDNIVVGNSLAGIFVNKSSNVLISGNSITQNKGDGIILLNSSNGTLINNSIVGNAFGIHMYSSNENVVSNNTFAENTVGGINLFSSSHNWLTSNLLVENNGTGMILDYSSDNNMISENTVVATDGYGLVIGSSKNNTFRNNTLTGNTYNFYCLANRPNLSDLLNDIDTSNTANGQPIYYFLNREGLIVDQTTFADIGYLALVNCTNVTVQDLSFSQNGQGLLLAFTNNSVVTHVVAAGNDQGIHLLTSSNNTITNNTLINNEDGITMDQSSNENIVAYNNIENSARAIRMVHHTDDNDIFENRIVNNTVGLFSLSNNVQNTIRRNLFSNNMQGISLIRQCSNNTIIQNTIVDNAQGLYLQYCHENSIFNNNFMNNTIHVMNLNSTNVWNSTYPSGGNFWSNYSVPDLDGDAIGDIGYIIDENNMDSYPLAGVFYDFEATTEHGEKCNIEVVSNSTVSNLTLLSPSLPSQDIEHKYIQFFVSGENSTAGFCRTLIPRDVLNGTYTVLVDGHEVSVKELPESNSTHAYIYFTYKHSEHQVVIIHELPSILAILIIMSILTIVTLEKRSSFAPETQQSISPKRDSNDNPFPH